MKKTMIITAMMLTVGWAAEIPPAAPATPGNMRQMPAFTEFDLDNDGKVTQSEFDQSRAKRMSERAEEGKMMRNAGNAPAFSQIDTNNDGVITPDEFKVHRMEQMNDPNKPMMQGKGMKCNGKCMGMQKPMKPNQMRQMPRFTDCDLDNNGKITQSEFDQSRAKRMSERAEEGKMMRNAGNAPAFSQIDTNNDGAITPDEFKAHRMQQMNNPNKPMMQGQKKCNAN